MPRLSVLDSQFRSGWKACHFMRQKIVVMYQRESRVEWGRGQRDISAYVGTAACLSHEGGIYPQHGGRGGGGSVPAVLCRLPAIEHNAYTDTPSWQKVEDVVISVAHILVSGQGLPQLIAVKNTTMMCCWTFFPSKYRTIEARLLYHGPRGRKKML